MHHKILRFFVSIFSLSLAFFSLPVHAAPGDIDRSFGTNGFVKTLFGTSSDMHGSAWQADGKLIVVGTIFQSGSNQDFYVLRINAGGGLDTSFDGDGIAMIAVSVREDVATNAAIQADGKIVVSGYSRDPNALYDFAAVRLNSDGSPDTAFDGDGIVITSTSGNSDWAHDVIIQADNQIVVAGQSTGGNGQEFTLVRYNTNGSLDSSFDGDGIVTTQFPEGASLANTVELQPDGKIVAAGAVGVAGGFINTVFGVARYNTNGSLDTSFGGGDGTATADVQIAAANQNHADAALIQADGKIVLVGTTNSGFATSNDFAIARFNADGTLDNSFDTDGRIVVPIQGANDDFAKAAVQQSDGKLIVGGYGRLNNTSDQDFIVMRFNNNGALDTRFGNKGIAVTRRPGDTERIAHLRILADGKIAAAGFTNFDAAFARYLINGSREADFDGDKLSDLAIFRPSVGEWWYLKSSDGGNAAAQFGNSDDMITPGDFTGDGKTDIAFWRPSTGFWFVLRSEDSSFYSFPFGAANDIPAVGDFDADGKADAAIFRPSTATWYVNQSAGGTLIQQFGQSGDVPVVADYDGDNIADIAIYRAAMGEWWIQRSAAGTIVFQFGNSSDKAVQGDYTGDGKADVAIWRPSTGEWFILRSENQSYYSFPFGTNGDVPAPGDYDGDGKLDASIFRPSNSAWFIQRTTAGTSILTFGQSGDRPVPNAFVP